MSADTVLVAVFVALFVVVAWWDHTARRHDQQQELDAYERMVGGGWG